MAVTRRECLSRGLLLGAALAHGNGAAYWRRPFRPVAALQAPDAQGLRLPPGFSARVVARSGQAPLPGHGFRWHGAPDGGACFAMPDGGWAYVSNAELPGDAGGVSMLRFAADGQLIDARRLLTGTAVNCAGGASPWGTWLSCEEHAAGLVWEVDPQLRRPPVPRPALGRFTHEAVAFDLTRRHIYLTEDLSDGRLYRFSPDYGWSLQAGTLEVVMVEGLDDGVGPWPLRWLPVQAVAETPTRLQQPASTAFNGGEGIAWSDDQLWFTSKGDERVWRIDCARNELHLVYAPDAEQPQGLRGPDNVCIGPAGQVLVAEDLGHMRLMVFTASGAGPWPLLQLLGHEKSEITGPAFSPDGHRLYFSSQRGPSNQRSDGITYEVTGPFFM